MKLKKSRTKKPERKFMGLSKVKKPVFWVMPKNVKKNR